MQRNSRSGKVGAAARGQPDQTANSRNENLKSAYYLSSPQDPQKVVEALLKVAERDFGDLDRGTLYHDCQTVVYGDGGAHFTGMDEHVMAGLFVMRLRKLKAEHQREMQVRERRAAIRVCEESRDGGRS